MINQGSIIFNPKKAVDEDNVVKQPIKALCQVCLKRYYQYTCPRCEALYCSLDCYTNHSKSCTEAFFHAQVVDRLLHQKPTEDEKKAFEKKLASFYNVWRNDEEKILALARHGTSETVFEFFSKDPGAELSGSDSEAVERDAVNISESRLETLKNLCTQSKLKLEDLTATERKMFMSWLKRIDLNSFIDSWTPWWNQKCYPVERIHVPQHLCCSVNEFIKNSRVSLPRVAYSILQMLYGVCWILRRFNGEIPSSDLLHALNEFGVFCPLVYWGLRCGSRQKSHPYETLLETTNFILAEAAKIAPRQSSRDKFPQLLFYDVMILLEEKWKTLKAIRDLRRLVCQAQRCIESSADKSEFLMLIRRLKYFTSVAYYHLFEMLSPENASCATLKDTKQFHVGNQKFVEKQRKPDYSPVPEILVMSECPPVDYTLSFLLRSELKLIMSELNKK